MSAKPDTDLTSRPYSPSWLNYFNGWVHRLPGPAWVYYVGLWLALVVILVAVLWIEGVFPVGTLFLVQFFIPAMIALMLGMTHYLDHRASAALDTLRPALKTDEEKYDQLQYRLTTLPALPTLLASVVTIGFVFLLGIITGETESSIEAVASSRIAAAFLFAVYWIGWWVFGAFGYHTIHQLWVINKIYTQHTRIQLFAQRPLYAFSGVTALTAAVLTLATYGWTALNPDNLANPVNIAVVVAITVLALVVFIWPLLGVHRLLREEKARLLEECSLRMEDAIGELHQQLDGGDLARMETLNLAMANLVIEKDTLDAIPTWPWQPETPRLLITALALPLGLWIIQYVLQLLLGA